MVRMSHFIHRQDLGAVPTADAPCVVVCGPNVAVWVAEEAGAVLPTHGLLAAAGVAFADAPLHVGLLDGVPLWLVPLDEGTALPAGCEWRTGRQALNLLDARLAQGFACALMLHAWRRKTKHCGVCGTPTESVPTERAVKCPRCGELFYPTAACAVIVGVTNADRLLLANNRNFKVGLFSLIAGFVDPGETLEEAVRRELREEVGIEARNIRYLRSQPWPFPNSLMTAFAAEYASGELRPDGVEIHEARWVSPDALPDLPMPGSISREVINEWLAGRFG